MSLAVKASEIRKNKITKNKNEGREIGIYQSEIVE